MAQLCMKIWSNFQKSFQSAHSNKTGTDGCTPHRDGLSTGGILATEIKAHPANVLEFFGDKSSAKYFCFAKIIQSGKTISRVYSAQEVIN